MGAGGSQHFPPQAEPEARERLLHTVRKPPELAGVQRSRWRLQDLLEVCSDWLSVGTVAGLWKLLKRLAIRYKRGRHTIQSPDTNYDAKMDLVYECLSRAREEPDDFVAVYIDEHTFYRQPLLGPVYEACGSGQAKAALSHKSNTSGRIVAAMNAITGQVTYRQASKTTLAQLRKFYGDLRADYPHAKQIYAIQDNWPVHFHPDVLAILQTQHFPFPPKMPATWSSDPRPNIKHLNLPIQIVCLPTYAFWTNPIEKLWRWLNQEVIYMHRFSHAWDKLKTAISAFLDQFAYGSSDLLRYVGLLPN
jgi:hypothetical protein